MKNIDIIINMLSKDTNDDLRKSLISNLTIIASYIGDDKIISFVENLLLNKIKEEPENENWPGILHVLNVHLNKKAN